MGQNTQEKSRIVRFPSFLRQEQREHLEELMRRNLFNDPKEAIKYCIDMTWFYQIGQYEDEDTVADVPQC